jgi:ABC-type antimicrobial peptide transport system permease subunit
VLAGSQADLVLTDPDAVDITLSAVDESVGAELLAMPEVEAVSGMLQGIVQSGDQPYFFVFGYPRDSFVLSRFQIVEGVGLYSREADEIEGRPILIGSAAAEAMHRQVGDLIPLTTSVYRIVGIFETGDPFEEGGSVMRLEDAQNLLGYQRQVSLFYVKLEPGASRQRLEQRVERKWPDLGLTTSDDLADRQIMGASVKAMVWAIAGISIVIGGVGMMNAQLMSVFERTREIGVLRAVGWSAGRVLRMILGESLAVGLLGGALGIAAGYGLLGLLQSAGGLVAAFGASTATIRPTLLLEAAIVVLVLGLVGGWYPAWRAARLQPVEALRYEGGGTGSAAGRLPVGGMALQSLWRRKARSALALGGIAVTVGAIMALDSAALGMKVLVNRMFGGSELIVRQADASDLGYAFLEERLGDRLAALPEIASVTGTLFTAVAFPDTGYFIIQGYAPHVAATRFNVVEGESLTSNRQMLLGRQMAESLAVSVGDSITVANNRWKVVGIFESGVAWEELGGVITLRDAQAFTGRPGKVTLFMVDLKDPAQAREMVEVINRQYPEVFASLSGEFADNMEEMQNTVAMLNAVSVMAIVVGGVGIMNSMLMAVLERTREIGALRALGWRRRAVLGLIVRESLWLGVIGGALGVCVAFALNWSLEHAPYMAGLKALWTPGVFVRAILVSLLLGLIGGLYPALRATRLEPVEALRYE